MPIEFAIEEEVVDERTHVVAVTGEIDLFTAPEFKQRVAAPIDAGTAHVVVDLTQTTFIDSSSLGVLIGAHKRLKLRDGGLTVVADSPTIASTFKVTGLDRVFRLVTSRDEALADAVSTSA